MERPVRRQASGMPHNLSEKPSALADGVFTDVLSGHNTSGMERVAVALCRAVDLRVLQWGARHHGNGWSILDCTVHVGGATVF